MRNSDIAALERSIELLTAATEELALLYEQVTAKKEKDRESYRKKAEYYRVYVKEWRAQNPDKVKQYDKTYQEKKRGKAKKQQQSKIWRTLQSNGGYRRCAI
jgi:hypothetical protein